MSFKPDEYKMKWSKWKTKKLKQWFGSKRNEAGKKEVKEQEYLEKWDEED